MQYFSLSDSSSPLPPFFFFHTQASDALLHKGFGKGHIHFVKESPPKIPSDPSGDSQLNKQ